MAQEVCPVCGGVRTSDWNNCYRCHGAGYIDVDSGGSSSSGGSSWQKTDYSHLDSPSSGSTPSGSGGRGENYGGQIDSQLIFSDGEDMLKRGDYNGAIKAYTQAIVAWPKGRIGGVYNQRGNAYLNLKDYERAIADFTQALSMPQYEGFTHIGPYCNRAICYIYLKEYDKTIAGITKAFDLGLERNPKYSSTVKDVYNNLGIAYEGNGNYDKARAAYQKAISLGDQNAKGNLATMKVGGSSSATKTTVVKAPFGGDLMGITGEGKQVKKGDFLFNLLGSNSPPLCGGEFLLSNLIMKMMTLQRLR
jgi:tetratricopeptide (TPR) repeat protein